MNDFELPTNVRQIGGVDEHLKIYVEDYAVYYLKRLAESGGDKEKIAFLVGKHMLIDGQDYLFICGIIQGRFTTYDEGCEIFTDESYEYANEQLERFFDGYEIVGWMQSQPGYGTGLNPVLADYHMSNFTKPHNVLMVCDPAERSDVFYSWDRPMNGISERQGYFIYYDKNRGMQEYMLENRIGGGKLKAFSKDKAAKAEADGKSAYVKTAGDDGKKRTEAVSPSVKSGARGPIDVRKKLEEKRDGSEYRRVVNMLISLGAVLFIICFIIGAGLIQSDGRLKELENNTAALSSSYGYLISQISQLNAQSVYASGDENRQASDISGQNEDEATGQEPGTPDENPDGETAQNGNSGEITATHTQTPPPATQSPSAGPTQSPSPTPEGSSLSGITVIPTRTETPPTQTPAATDAPNEGEVSGESMDRPLIMDYDTYVVQQGDTLSQICWNYYGSTDYLQLVMDFNSISDPDTIYYGKVIKMPRP